jgi:hypothetical protein
MKRCCTCNRKYADETHQYCLDDGSLLTKAFDIDATLDLNDPLDLDATILIDDSTDETPEVTKPTRKPKPKKNFINDPVIAISVDEQFPHCETENDLYTCTRGLWRLDHERAGRAKYAFAIYKGAIKEVYEIEQWLPATKVFSDFWVARLESQGRTISADEHIGRYEFTGHVAPEPIRKKYLRRKLPKRHSGNPIMYFNC